MIISTFYSSLIGILFLILTIRIIRIRRKNKIILGDDGNLLLQKAIRAQANFCETAPIALILLILAENNGMHILLGHIFGLTLLIGRIIHSYGISMLNEDFRFRIFGMTLTFMTIGSLVIINLFMIFFTNI